VSVFKFRERRLKGLPDFKGLKLCAIVFLDHLFMRPKELPGIKGLKMFYAPYLSKKHMLPPITKLQFDIVSQKTSHLKCSPQKKRMTTPVIERVNYGSID
jgi:hypothetical protein